MPLRMGQQRPRGLGQIGFDQRHGLARDQRHRGVDHVLAGAAEMHEAHGVSIEKTDRLLQALDQRDRDAAGAAAVAHDLGDIEQLDLAAADDGLRGRFGNHPELRLGARQRGLEAQHRVDEVAVAEGGQCFGSGEKAFEDAHGGWSVCECRHRPQFLWRGGAETEEF